MARSVPAHTTTGVNARLAAFVLERFPFAAGAVQRAISSSGGRVLLDPSGHQAFRKELERQLRDIDVGELPETTPGVTAEERWSIATDELFDAIDGFVAREAIAASLTADEKLEIMRGMVLMRAVDNRLKQFYLQSEVKYGN